MHESLQGIHSRGFNAVYGPGGHGLDMGTAAYAHALRRIGQAIEAVGGQGCFKGGR